MPLSSHTTAGAGQLGTLLKTQPEGVARGLRTCVDRRPGRYGLQTRVRLGPIQQLTGLLAPKPTRWSCRASSRPRWPGQPNGNAHPQRWRARLRR